MGLAVVLHQLPHDAINLHRQLARGGDDDHTSAIAWLELRAVQQLDAGYEERLHGAEMGMVLVLEGVLQRSSGVGRCSSAR